MTNRQWTTYRYEEGNESALLQLLTLEYSESDVAEWRFFRWQYEQNLAGRAPIWVASSLLQDLRCRHFAMGDYGVV